MNGHYVQGGHEDQGHKGLQVWGFQGPDHDPRHDGYGQDGQDGQDGQYGQDVEHCQVG